MKSLPRQCFSMFPPTCLHDSADCSNRFPDHPPLKVKGVVVTKWQYVTRWVFHSVACKQNILRY